MCPVLDPLVILSLASQPLGVGSCLPRAGLQDLGSPRREPLGYRMPGTCGDARFMPANV